MPRKKKGSPSQIDLLEARTATAPCVPAIKQKVAEWRANDYKGITDTTRLLLNHWFHTDHRLANGSKFAYLEHTAFGETVDLRGPAMVRAIASNVAQYVTVKTFVDVLRKLVVEELLPQLLDAGRPLSETPPFPWSRRTLKADKCVFNLVPCENAFEEEFARFLEKADDVERFAKLPDKFGFTIDYSDGSGNLRYYEPDFVVVADDGTHHIVETKGLEDVNVANKDRAAKLWCENTSALTGNKWAYLKVLQTEFKQLQPTLFSDLNALRNQPTFSS